jgi:hypothetical protein
METPQRQRQAVEVAHTNLLEMGWDKLPNIDNSSSFQPTRNMSAYGSGLLRSLFPHPLTPELFEHRRNEQFPFVSLDYFISKATVYFNDMNHNRSQIQQILDTQTLKYESTGEKPIIFVPSEYILFYAQYLTGYMTPFHLITVSNQPFCLPFFKYPEFCQDLTLKTKYCDPIHHLLVNPFLEKWFMKNPCIEHAKIIPIPLGPKWQFFSLSFFDENIDHLSFIYRSIGLKPFALFKNYTYMLHDNHPEISQYRYFLQQQQKKTKQQPPSSQKIDLSSSTSLLLPKTSYTTLTPSQSYELQLIRQMEDFYEYDEAWDLYYQDQLKINPFQRVPTLNILQSYYKGKDKLLYFNFDIATTDQATFSAHAFVRRTIEQTLLKNGFDKSPKRPLAGFLQELSEYQFCICPPGKGIDTHRTWEALMVGTIPIVLSSPLDALYDDFPVVIVKSFEKITPAMLRNIYKMVHASGRTYDFSKLYMPYWDAVIR